MNVYFFIGLSDHIVLKSKVTGIKYQQTIRTTYSKLHCKLKALLSTTIIQFFKGV